MNPETELSVPPHTQPSPLLTGRAFDPRVPIIRSTTRIIGALVFGHHFLSEEPIFLELIQTINLGLAFVSTIWRRVIGSWVVCRPWDCLHSIQTGASTRVWLEE